MIALSEGGAIFKIRGGIVVNYRISYLFSRDISHQYSTSEIKELTGLTEEGVQDQLEELSKKGLIKYTAGEDKIVFPPIKDRKWATTLSGITQMPFYRVGERMALIYLCCYRQSSQVSIFSLQDFLLVSKGTVIADIKRLRSSLKKDGISLNYSRQSGFNLVGSESVIRRIAINYITQLQETETGVFSLLHWLFEIRLDHFAKIKDLCLAKVDEFNLSIVLGRLDTIVFFLAGSVFRLGNLNRDDFSLSAFPSAENITRASLEVLKSLADPSNSDAWIGEVKYLACTLMTILNGRLAHNDFKELYACSDEVVTRMEGLAAVKFPDRKALINNLFFHLVPAYFRINMGFSMSDKFFASIQQQYGDIYRLTDAAIEPFRRILETAIPEEEIGYFTILFGGAMYHVKQPLRTDVARAIIVCPNGLSSSFILQAELNKLFPLMNFKATGAIEDLNSIPQNQFDVVFTTIPLDERFSDQEIIVTPIMTSLQKNEVQLRVQEKVFQPGISFPNVKEIVDVLKPHIILRSGVSEEDLYQAIANKMNKRTNQKEDVRPMLTELITPEMIQFTSKRMDWKKAIAVAAKPLRDFGFIEERYIEAMIQKVEQYGAFIHIGKGIAMPHARPEDGARKVGMSILKVANPVLLLGQDAHAITIFICLSAVDNTTHLRALSELTTVLSDEKSLNRLLSAKSKEEIITVLSGGED